MLDAVAVKDLIEALTTHATTPTTGPGPAGAQYVDAMIALEHLDRWVAARRYELIDALHEHRLTQGSWEPEATRSVETEVAMATGTSRGTAAARTCRAGTLRRLPRVAALLAAGEVSERVACEVLDEARHLDPDQMAALDDRLAPVLADLTPKRAEHAARTIVLQLDPCAAERQARQNRTDRYVTSGPGPTGTAWLTVHGPAEQVAAAYEAVHAHAAGRFADGDPRSMGQLMCDTAIERLTGIVDVTDPRIVLEVGVLMDADSLLGDQDVPAMMAGHGPLPAGLARRLVDQASRTWVRRFFTDPVDDTVVARDSRRRRFDGPLRHLVDAAERHCQRPGCDCRARDVDHVEPHAEGGRTTLQTAQSLCRPDHTTRHLPGWDVTRDPRTRTTRWRTPTGHTYDTTRPPALGHGLRRTPRYRSVLEREVARLAHPAP
ncbi:MAG: HNH endonuclease [Nocardioidaceae bacterium]|nr:HNH endonuclease [Nocardioidaceae bacterium]